MRRLVLFALTLAIPGAPAADKLVLHPGEGAPDRYVVRIASQDTAASTEMMATQLAIAYGGAEAEIGHVFVHTVPGFSVSGLSLERARLLAADDRVVYVEQDRRVHLFQQASEADRLDPQGPPLDGVSDGSETGRGVHAFIIDTGIRADHEEFPHRRLGQGTDLVRDGRRGPEECPTTVLRELGDAGDLDPLLYGGHGTHMAGVLGGESYGVANGVTLHSVRVLDCYGRGFASDLIAGIDWVTGYVVRQRERHSYPAVVTIGVGVFGRRGPRGWPRSLVDEVTRSSIASGITYVVAAGNFGSERGSTCLDIAPARVWEAVTVGATGSRDGVVSVPRFSSRGPCVDIHAPGVDIESAWHRSTRDSAVLTGTSVAAPVVAGAVARMLERNPQASPDELVTELYRSAKYDALYDDTQSCLEDLEDDETCTPPTWLGRYTPNRFLCTGAKPNDTEGTRLDIVRGVTRYRYRHEIRDWDVPISVRSDSLLAAVGAPFSAAEQLRDGSLDIEPVHAAWHRWEPHIEEISLLRGPVLYRFDYRTLSWSIPLDIAHPHSTWAMSNGPFEKTRDPIDVAWHRYEAEASYPSVNEIVVMRGPIQYTFDLTNQLRVIGELHEGVWRAPKNMSLGGFMRLPGGPFVDGDTHPLDAAYHVREDARSELVLIRGSTEHRYDYVRRVWNQPRDLGSLSRGAVWHKDRAPFYELDSDSPPDAAWFQELRPHPSGEAFSGRDSRDLEDCR